MNIEQLRSNPIVKTIIEDYAIVFSLTVGFLVSIVVASLLGFFSSNKKRKCPIGYYIVTIFNVINSCHF